MDKAGKTVALETLKGVFGESGAVVVTHYTGLTVAEMTKLRGMLRKDGAQLAVPRLRALGDRRPLVRQRPADARRIGGCPPG